MLRVMYSAFTDIRAGLRLRRVWLALAAEDIGDQHRRTALGPLWLLINYFAFAATFIFVFRSGEATADYPAYVATGLFVWLYIMDAITQSVQLFVREESFIKGTTLPLSVYVMRLTVQSAIRAGYALVGCIAILLMTGANVSVGWAWSALGILTILMATPAVIIVFAFVGAYFPDSQFIVSNIMRIGMFLTPVFWIHTGEEGGVRAAFYYWNPFTYFLEIVRAPILSGDLAGDALAICAAIGLAAWAIAILLLGRLRKKVVFIL